MAALRSLQQQSRISKSSVVEVGPEKAKLPRSGEMSVQATRHSVVRPLGRAPSPPGGGGGHAGMDARGKCLQREIKCSLP